MPQDGQARWAGRDAWPRAAEVAISHQIDRPSSESGAITGVLPRELIDLPPTLTVEQAARLLRIGRNQAYEAVAAGELPAMRVGRRWVIPTVRLLRLLGVGDLGPDVGARL